MPKENSRSRYVVECVWGGPSRSWTCHRRVHPKARALRYAQITSVQFDDGTSMSVSVRPAKPREKVREINGYTTLLNRFIDAGKVGFVRVADLDAPPAGGAAS